MTLNFKRILRQIPVIKRLYSSLSTRIFKLIKKKYFLLQFKGIKFSLDINEPIDKSIILFNYYENNQINTSIKLISKYNASIYFDIGANCGIYSLILAEKFNNLKIYSFEPIKLSYNKFVYNISINKNKKNIQNIKLYNFGLSNKNTNLKMKALIKNNYTQLGGFGVLNKYDDLKNNFLSNANFKKGDDLFKFQNKIIFLKIDVEGHEFHVLEGFQNLFKKNKIILQIEILPKNQNLVKKRLLELKFTNIMKIDFDFYFINKN